MDSSGRLPLPGARRLATPRSAGDDELDVTVFLRCAGRISLRAAGRQVAALPLCERPEPLTHKDLAQRFGPDPDAVRRLCAAAGSGGLTVLGEPHAASRSVVLRGPTSAVQTFFGVGDLGEWERGAERYRGRTGTLTLPPEVADDVVAVLGLDDRRVAWPDTIPSHEVEVAMGGNVRGADGVDRYCTSDADGTTRTVAGAAGFLRAHTIPSHTIPSHTIPSHTIPSHTIPSHTIPSHGGETSETTVVSAGFLPTEVAAAYDFPAGSGRGQTIGVLALTSGRGPDGQRLSGGYTPGQLQQAFADLGLSVPEIHDIAVRPGRDANTPGPGTSPHDFSAEVLLDLQVAGALAPQAKFVVYFSESTEQGFAEGVWRAVTDEEHDLSVLLICYGSPEGAEGGSLWTKMAVDEIDRAFAAAALRGITVVTSCGDNGAADSPWSTRVRADFPAASPFVLSCGGTRLDRLARLPGGEVVYAESVWNDGRGASGGGVSRVFARPPWQDGIGVPPSADYSAYPGRGVPDVAALADPETGVIVRNPAGEQVLCGGTSVAAPVWAALVARLDERLGQRVGLLAPLLYEAAGSGALNDVLVGDNGAYRAGPGWDACTGLGTPSGQRLLAVLGAEG